MVNKATSTTCHSCDNPYFVRAQIIAKSAGSPAYRFGIDESVSLPGNQHGFVRDILDGGKIYVVQLFESTEYRCYAWLDMRPEYGYKDIGSVYGKPNPYKPLPVSNYNHTVRFLLGFLYFYDIDLSLTHSQSINLSKASRKPSPFESFTRIGFCTKKHATTTFVQMIFSGSDRPCCE